MANVFLSYSRPDEDRATAIAERIASLGYSVTRCEQPLTRLQAAFDDANAVVVVWSRHSRESIRVRAAAAGAADRGNLVQLRLDAALPPAPFDRHPAAEISASGGDWAAIESALTTAAGASSPIALASARWFDSTAGLMLAALAAAVLSLALGLIASLQGVLRAEQLGIIAAGALGASALTALAGVWRFFATARAGS